MSRTSKKRRDSRKRKREKKSNKQECPQEERFGLAQSLCLCGIGLIALGALIGGPFWYELLVKPPGASRAVALFPLVLGPFFGFLGTATLIAAGWLHFRNK